MTEMPEHHMPVARCLNPHCGREVDAATPLGHNDAPEEGNISICFYCGQAAEYAADLTLRPITDPDKISWINNDPQIAKLRAFIANRGPYPEKRETND